MRATRAAAALGYPWRFQFRRAMFRLCPASNSERAQATVASGVPILVIRAIASDGIWRIDARLPASLQIVIWLSGRSFLTHSNGTRVRALTPDLDTPHRIESDRI